MPLVLNRWARPDRPLLHSVKATEVVYFQGHRYSLASTVCHLGALPHGGHYVAVAKHGPASNDWYVYDDDHCFPADPEHISARASNYKHWGNLQSYILFYAKSLEVGSGATASTT